MTEFVKRLRNDRRFRERLSGIALVICMGSFSALFISCLTIQNGNIIVPEIPGATFVGNDQCSLCHEQIVKDFVMSSHARLGAPEAQMVGASGCEACHGPGSRHVEATGDNTAFIINPGKSPDACLNCHMDIMGEFQLPFHHPVLEGKMNCIDCHDPHGHDAKKPAGLAMARVNDTCAQCHAEQARPHVFEHEALREGCTTCHDVHGSTNKKMLVENNAMLCLKCHTQIQTAHGNVVIGARDHVSTFLPRGTCWSAGCHTAPHGSNMNSHFRY